jgi:hypothetical protein
MRTAHDLRTRVKAVLKIGFDHIREGGLGISNKLRKSLEKVSRARKNITEQVSALLANAEIDLLFVLFEGEVLMANIPYLLLGIKSRTESSSS